MGRTVKVSDKVYAALQEIKRREGHLSVDSVIRKLLLRAGYDI